MHEVASLVATLVAQAAHIIAFVSPSIVFPPPL
jgi:hypothetical protein